MKVDLLAVLVAAGVHYVLGTLWYAPFAFGKVRDRLAGSSKKKASTDNVGQKYVLAFLSALVMSYILAYVLAYTAVTTVLSGIYTGFWLWLGFVATTSLGGMLWEKKSFKLYALNNAYFLLSLIMMSALLAVWR